jgi:3-methyladenine DNA glycosylase AlkD
MKQLKMNSEELKNYIINYCKANSNEANIVKYGRFFKGGNFVGYGLNAPQMYGLVKDLLKTQKVTFDVVLGAAPSLIKSPNYEEITIALLLVNDFGKQYSKPLFTEIEKWYSFSINNWAHADTLGMFILPQFLKYKVIDYKAFKSWLTSKHKFQRRSVPVTFIKLLKSKTVDDFSPIFTFIEPLITDPEREVHQGVGWFLREAWKLKKLETEEFLMKWKDIAPRLIIQYATEKMTAEEKLRFRKTKIS